MLKQRIITAAILIPLVLALILLPPTAFFASLVAIVFVGAAWEWSLLSGCRTPLGRGIVAAAAAAIFIALIVVRTPGLLLMLTLIGVAWWIGCCFWLRHFTFAAAPNAENRLLKLGVGALVIVPTLASAILLHESSRGNWWTLLSSSGPPTPAPTSAAGASGGASSRRGSARGKPGQAFMAPSSRAGSWPCWAAT